MINKDDLVSLSWEQKVKFRAAIEYGYLDHYEDNPREWRHSLVGSLIMRYPQRCATLNRLRDIIGHEPTWEDIDDDVLHDFVDETQESMARSSARTICAELKAVLNRNRRKIPSADFSRILSVKGEASQHVYLNREEIQLFAAYKAVTDLEHYVKRIFLVQLLTGARRSDAERLAISNCDEATGMLSYVPRKTPGIVVTVPVDERLHLREHLVNARRRQTDTDTFNDTVRRICRECHIDTPCTIRRRGSDVTAPKHELVTSHTARRSFATNLYLAGISLEDIAMMMGHGKNIETTKRYICAERPFTRVIQAYFKPEQQRQPDIDAYSYNRAVDDLLEYLITHEVIASEGLTFREIENYKVS